MRVYIYIASFPRLGRIRSIHRGGWTRSHDSPRDQILCMGIPYETLFSQSSCLRPIKVISFESTCLIVSENPLNPLQPWGTRGAMQLFPFLLEPNRHSSLFSTSDKQFLHEVSAQHSQLATLETRLENAANTKEAVIVPRHMLAENE